jgi:hypothetical protein
MTAITEAARRKIAALQPVIVSERRSRESNDLYRRSPLIPLPQVIPNWRRFARAHPRPSQIGVDLRGFALPITRCPDHQISIAPPSPFSTFVTNKGTYADRRLGLPCVTLGWPLRGPWVAQGPSKPNPKPNPSRQRVATALAVQIPSNKYPPFLARSQRLVASSFLLSKTAHPGTPHPMVNVELYHLFAFLSSVKLLLRQLMKIRFKAGSRRHDGCVKLQRFVP